MGHKQLLRSRVVAEPGTRAVGADGKSVSYSLSKTRPGTHSCQHACTWRREATRSAMAFTRWLTNQLESGRSSFPIHPPGSSWAFSLLSWDFPHPLRFIFFSLGISEGLRIFCCHLHHPYSPKCSHSSPWTVTHGLPWKWGSVIHPGGGHHSQALKDTVLIIAIPRNISEGAYTFWSH